MSLKPNQMEQLLKRRRKNLKRSEFVFVMIQIYLVVNRCSVSKRSCFCRTRDSASEVEEFDQNAAFFTKVVSKKKKVAPIAEQPTIAKGKAKTGDAKTKEEDVSILCLGCLTLVSC